MGQWIISRVVKHDLKPLKSNWITVEEWYGRVESSQEFVKYEDSIFGRKHNIKKMRNVILTREDDGNCPKITIGTPADDGYMRIWIDKLKDSIEDIEFLLGLAESLDAYLLKDYFHLFTRKDLDAMKAKAAKKKLLKKPLYTEGVSGNDTWAAVRSESVEEILHLFGVQGAREMGWEEGFRARSQDWLTLVLPPAFGWVLIMGQSVPDLLLGGPSTGDFARELSAALARWSKKTSEAHFYHFYDRSYHSNAYFKARDGKFVYGSLTSSELPGQQLGKLPKELKKLKNDSAYDVADIWSINPMDLVYMKEMEGANILVF